MAHPPDTPPATGQEAAERPRVGVGVLLLRGDRVLLGLRRGAHGAGTWALPGGHLEFGESPEDCARREVLEETGLVAGDLQRGPFTSDVFAAERRHYLTVYLLAPCPDGEPQVREPDKCAGWRWVRWGDWPGPLFAPLRSLVDSGYAPPAAPA